MTTFFNGSNAVIVPKFDIIECCQYIEKYKISIFLAVPPMLLLLARNPATTQYSMKSLRLISSGAAPLPITLLFELKKRFESVQGTSPWLTQGTNLFHSTTYIIPSGLFPSSPGYGSTETSPACHFLPHTLCWSKAGSAGMLVPNTEARLVDTDTGKDVSPTFTHDGRTAPGELWIRGPIVMKGYLNNPTATRNTITEDGWYKSGDVACVDEDGCYYIVDRVKELIKYKGFQGTCLRYLSMWVGRANTL